MTKNKNTETKIDRRLVFIYSENARTRLVDVAGILKKSPQRLHYTLHEYSKRGILRTPHAIIDYSYFGLLLFKVYFKGYLSHEEIAPLTSKIQKIPSIVSMYTLEGDADFCVEVMAPNPSRFNKTLGTIHTILSSMLEYHVIVNVVNHHYPRLYLVKGEMPMQFKNEFIIGGDRPTRQFSNEELSVLCAYALHPLKPMTVLARQSRMHILTFKRIMRSLVHERILRGVKYLVDISAFQGERVRLFIQTHSLTNEERTNILELMKKTNEIVRFTWTIGDWNIEIDVETDSRLRMRSTIVMVRSVLRGVIKNMRSAEITEYFSRAYLPRTITEQVPEET